MDRENMLSFGKVGDKVIVIEHTYTGETFEWEGEIKQVTSAFIETIHQRNPITHPQWIYNYPLSYLKTWTKHYGLSNIKKS